MVQLNIMKIHKDILAAIIFLLTLLLLWLIF